MTKRKIYRQLQNIGLLLLLTSIWLASPVRAQDPAPSAAETAVPFDPRFGVVDSFVNTAEANAAGVGWTRVFFRWDVVQPAGPTDWKPTNVPDTYLNAEIAAGREVVAVLIGTPTWAAESGASTAVPSLEYWGDFVFKIANQYKGRVKHWVIWNQPDVTDPTSPSHTWGGTEEDYYRLLKEAYQKIKAVDPEMQVHLAGLTYTWDRDRGNPQYLARLLKVIMADPQAAAENYFFDVVSYHLYYNPRQIFEILTDVRSMLDAHGLGAKPIWINETNAPPSEDYLEPLTATPPLQITLQEQSAFVIQAFALALAGGAERVAFNKMRNETLHPESVEPYGLLRGDNSRRPAFAAFQVVTTHFAGMQKTSWLQQGEVYIVTLARGEQTTTVLWNTALEPLSFTLNAVAPQALLVDEQGNEQTIVATNGAYVVSLPGAACSNGANCFIGGSPRLIIESGSADQRLALLPLASPTPGTTPVLPAQPAGASSTPTLASPGDSSLASLPAEPSTPAAPPTLTPTPIPPAELLVTPEPLVAVVASPAVAALLDLGTDQSSVIDDDEIAQSETPALSSPVPPVTVATVLRPERILWLLIIGLAVFTVSYGVQVAIWYRLRR